MDFTECYRDTVSSVAAAARTGSVKQVRRLIKRGFSVDCRDNRGWNALHEAAAFGNKECVREILTAAGNEFDHFLLLTCAVMINVTKDLIPLLVSASSRLIPWLPCLCELSDT